MKILFNFLALFVVLAFVLPSCTIVREGEVGVKRTLGKYQEKSVDKGVAFYNPLITTIQKVSTQTENLEVRLNLPSKEGLNIRADISILYSLDGSQAAEVLRQLGINYDRSVVLPIFRSAVADVSARYFAKDMHTGQRAIIEEAIRVQMMTNLEGRGINIENVLVKSIELPVNLARSIEEKLEAEQQALRMEFVLQQAKQEADQQRIRAEGTRDAQLIIAAGLTPQVLKFKSIEAFLELAKSPNTKIIVSDGDLPIMLDDTVPVTSSKKK